MRRVLLVIAALIAVAGCTRYWARPGATQAELDAAKTRCDTDAVTRFPLSVQSPFGNAATFASSATQCSFGPAGPACWTYGGTEFDLNGQPRASAFRACMISAGWLPAKDRDDADRIARMRGPVGPPSASAFREASVWCGTMFNARRNAAVMAVYHDVGQCVAIRSRDLN